MKTLMLAATALLSIGTGAAFAESGDGWDLAQTLSTTPAMARSAQPQAMAPATSDSIVIAHTNTKNSAAASGSAASPQPIAAPAAPRFQGLLMGYPLNWGSG